MYNNKNTPETMSKSIGTSPQMQDVPLSAIEEQEAPHGDPPTVVHKSSSLKRFFKMPLKRTNTKDSVNEKAKTEVSEVPNEAEQLPQASQSRFHLRLGGMNKFGNEVHPPANADQKPSANKVNLKKSISNYWNSVFKRNPHTARHKGGKESDDIDAALNEAADKLAHIGDEDNKDDDQAADIAPNAANVSETSSEEALGAVGGEQTLPTDKDKAAEEVSGNIDVVAAEEIQNLAKDDTENVSTT